MPSRRDYPASMDLICGTATFSQADSLVIVARLASDFSNILGIFRKRLDKMCRILHTMSMADIRQSILDRMLEFGWTINHVSVLVQGRIPRRTVYAYLTRESDTRTEVASVLMEVLGLTITSKPVRWAGRPRKERGE
jgi:hypothetical protein